MQQSIHLITLFHFNMQRHAKRWEYRMSPTRYILPTVSLQAVFSFLFFLYFVKFYTNNLGYGYL